MKRSPLTRKTPLKSSTSIQRKNRRVRYIKIDLADKYFSLYIRFRDNWTCQNCLTRYEPGSQGLHASHFWSRGRESTRFDPINVSSHCFSCHSEMGGNPELHRAWKLKQIGQREYDLLMIRAHTTQKKDRKLAAIIYRALYQKEKARYEETHTLTEA